MAKVNPMDLAHKINHSLPKNLLEIIKCLLPELSPKESECLFWVANGHPYTIIAKRMDISERTVKFHITNCVTKLDGNNVYELKMIYNARLLTYLLLGNSA
jgi:DNA-binding CsgD family transcriptional regulator